MLLVKVFAVVIWVPIIAKGLNVFLEHQLIRKRKKLKRKVLKYLQDAQERHEFTIVHQVEDEYKTVIRFKDGQEIDITLIEKQQPCKHQS